jgi:hypothetical protein
MLKILDLFFIIFHTALIIFNLFAWIIKKTRKLNLITLLLTGGSWFVLGIFYGMGYCPLTDWHFKILERMGQDNLPDSYIKYLADRLTGFNFNPSLVELMTLMAFFTALVVSVFMNIRDFKRDRYLLK